MTSTSLTSAYRHSVSFRRGDRRPTRYNMAKAGFYYTGNDLVVKCCACKSIITCFRKGDDPLGTAAHHSNCLFSIREMENGVSTSASAAAAAASSAVSRSNDTGGFVSDTNGITSSSLLTTAAAATAVAYLGESRTVIIIIFIRHMTGQQGMTCTNSGPTKYH